MIKLTPQQTAKLDQEYARAKECATHLAQLYSMAFAHEGGNVERAGCLFVNEAMAHGINTPTALGAIAAMLGKQHTTGGDEGMVGATSG